MEADAAQAAVSSRLPNLSPLPSRSLGQLLKNKHGGLGLPAQRTLCRGSLSVQVDLTPGG